MADLANENLRLRELLERMALVFSKWHVPGQEGLLAEVREALK